jgi:hypothetical protein
VKRHNFTRKALFLSPNFGEGIVIISEGLFSINKYLYGYYRRTAFIEIGFARHFLSRHLTV